MHLPFQESTVLVGRRARWRRLLGRDMLALCGLLVCYTGLAYGLVPAWWRHHERFATLRFTSTITRTAQGIPGDPVNVTLVGTETEVVGALIVSGWYPADSRTFRTSIRIARDIVIHHMYPQAPVSDLYLFGRKQDLAFQQPTGGSPSKRHHVRLWLAFDTLNDRPIWFGATTFDRSVGFSHRTGQITHHIAADVDEERDKFLDDLARAGQLVETFRVPGIGPTTQGRNGGGDRYFTDGFIVVGIVTGY
jgi:hypothetical protein